MSKKGTKALASATLMSLVLTTALSAGPVKAAQGSVTRVGEADRYATAAKVATTNWTTSDNVVLVSGEGYADAVSASALAKKLDAPILLTTAGSLNSDTKAALNTLKAKNVYVVGGNASVSASVRADLKANYNLVELGGANRYETNAAVAQKLVDLGVDPSNAIMVGGEGFSDALSVAPIAAAKGQILLLGMNDSNYMKPVLDFVAKNKSNVTVVGTKNVISDAILNTVKGTRVDGGKDRWDTNQKVLSNFKDTVKMDSLYVASAAYNAQDNGYADALVASALAGKKSAPLVLVDKDGNEGTASAIAYIKANATDKTDLNVVGGTGVVSDATVNAINDAVKPVNPVFNGTITSVETVKDQFVNAKANDETLKFTVNGGTQVTAQDVVNAGYSIEFTTTESVLDSNDSRVSKDGILSKDKLQSFIGTDSSRDFKYSVKISKNDEVIGQTANETVTVINGDATANSLSDITVKHGVYGSETTKITSGKLYKGETATVTKVKGTIANASGVTITNKKFYSSDPFVATVDETTGQINAINPGTFTLTVKSGSVSKDYTFTVTSDTSRKVTSATASTSSIKIGKGADTTFTVEFKDQYGDLIEAKNNSSATEDDQFQISTEVKDGSTTVAAITLPTDTDDGDGKATIKVEAKATSGKGNIKVYNKNGVILTVPVEVVADTAVNTVKLEAASDDSDSKDLTIDLDPKSADDNGDMYVKLNLNKYGLNGTYLGKVKSGEAVTITATNDSNKKILASYNSTTSTTKDISVDSEGNFAIGIPAASKDDYKADNFYDLLTNEQKDNTIDNVATGTITITAKYGDKTSSITVKIKDSTPSISSANFNTGLSTTFGSIQLKDVIDASKINVSTSQGDGKVRVAQDGTIFIKADASKNEGGIKDINDDAISYDVKKDITLGKIKVAAKSGDVDTAPITISGGSFTVNSKSSVTSSPSGYVRIGIQRVHESNIVNYVDVKVANNN